MLRVLSLGAGVQSSTLALMCAHGEFEPVEHAVFADTGAEPAAVYRWLDWLTAEIQRCKHPFAVHRVQHKKGALGPAALEVRTSALGNRYTKHAIPAFITDGVSTGLAMRQCTLDFKITVILRAYQGLRAGREVQQLIGISFDELHRMKSSPRAWLTNVYPLVDARITRLHCLEWMKAKGYPQPPRSACTFCPYHSDAEWLRLKTQEPEAFQQATEFEVQYQASLSQVMRGKPFLHRSLQPLDTIDFEELAKTPQQDMFGNECEGMCGV